MLYTFTATFEQDEGMWVGQVVEVPGAISQGATIEEARTNLQEALQLILESYREAIPAETIQEPIQVSA